MCLTAAAALYEFASLAYHLGSVFACLYEIVGEGYGEVRLVAGHTANDYSEIGGILSAKLECDVLCALSIEGEHPCNYLDTTIRLCGLFNEVFLKLGNGLGLKLIDLSLELLVVGNSFLYCRDEVGSIVEESTEFVDEILRLVESLLDSLARDGLYTAYTSSDAALRHDTHHANAARGAGMTTTAKLDAAAKLHYTHLVAVFLTKESDSTKFLSLLDRSVAIFL